MNDKIISLQNFEKDDKEKDRLEYLKDIFDDEKYKKEIHETSSYYSIDIKIDDVIYIIKVDKVEFGEVSLAFHVKNDDYDSITNKGLKTFNEIVDRLIGFYRYIDKNKFKDKPNEISIYPVENKLLIEQTNYLRQFFERFKNEDFIKKLQGFSCKVDDIEVKKIDIDDKKIYFYNQKNEIAYSYNVKEFFNDEKKWGMFLPGYEYSKVWTKIVEYIDPKHKLLNIANKEKNGINQRAKLYKRKLEKIFPKNISIKYTNERILVDLPNNFNINEISLYKEYEEIMKKKE